MKCAACKYEGEFDYLEFRTGGDRYNDYESTFEEHEVDIELRFRHRYQGRGIDFVKIHVCPECSTLRIKQ